MEILKKTPILDFRPDTLQFVRKQHGLESSERMNEAIQILEEWIDKQNHFEQKTFSKDYLERVIINNKGLVEKSKKKIDRICTFRTLSPNYFEIFDLKECDFSTFKNAILPKLTPNHERVHAMKFVGKLFSTKTVRNFYRYIILICDYQQAYDYCNGMLIFCDFTECSVGDFVINSNPMELKKFLEIFMNGYSMRLKGIHYLTSSKTIEGFLNLTKPLLSSKLNQRTFIHKSVDSLYEHIPKECLPKEYDGEYKTFTELQDMTMKEVTSKDFLEYKKEMLKCRSNEALRQPDQFNDEYMGVSGTFRNLIVD